MPDGSRRRAGRAPFHYAWIVGGVTFLVLIVTAGIRATPGVLMVPLEAEFGWSRAAISAAVAVNIGSRLDRDRPPTVKLTSQAFGRENTGVVYGWIGASHQLGASLAAFGAGAIRTVAGGYQLAFWLAGLLCVLAGAAFLTVGRRSFAGAPRHEAIAAVPA